MSRFDSLKLVRRDGKGAPPVAPFGATAFDDSATNLAIEVSREDTVESLLARIPRADELTRGASVVVLGGAARGFFAKVLGSREPLHRATRATALLALGYVAIEAGIDEASGEDFVAGNTPN